MSPRPVYSTCAEKLFINSKHSKTLLHTSICVQPFVPKSVISILVHSQSWSAKYTSLVGLLLRSSARSNFWAQINLWHLAAHNSWINLQASREDWLYQSSSQCLSKIQYNKRGGWTSLIGVPGMASASKIWLKLTNSWDKLGFPVRMVQILSCRILPV